MPNRSTAAGVLLVLMAMPATGDQMPPELREAMRARLEAVWTKDSSTWDRLTADEFTIVVPEGTLQSKAERLTALEAEKPQAVHSLQREQFQRYGETVVHRFVDADEWVLEVWVRQDGVWRVVAAQVNIARP
jgi:hypothetical protein